MQAGLIAQAGRRAIKQKAEAALIPDPFVTLICSVKTNHYIIQAGDLKSTLVFSHTTLGTSVCYTCYTYQILFLRNFLHAWFFHLLSFMVWCKSYEKKSKPKEINPINSKAQAVCRLIVPFNLHPDFWKSSSWEIKVYFQTLQKFQVLEFFFQVSTLQKSKCLTWNFSRAWNRSWFIKTLIFKNTFQDLKDQLSCFCTESCFVFFTEVWDDDFVRK